MRKFLSIEYKQSLVEKALNRGDKPLSSVAKENNVSESTLRDWISYSRSGKWVNRSERTKTDYSPVEKLNHLVETWKLSETEQGAYCREKGLYAFELKNWKEKFMLETNEKKASDHWVELKQLRAENKSLKQELHRKDKALSETAALLVLKKKANLIWGEYEEV